MNAITHSKDPLDFDIARARLVRDSQLHWFHGLAIGLSLTITFGAWYVSKQYAEEKLSAQFDRESAQVVALVSDRMLKYEDALWGGVDAIAAAKGTNSEFNEHNWRAFSGTLQIGKKSPGISGIGVIHRVEPGELASYLAQQRRTRAQFRVHPAHRQNEYMPITFIEPMAPNLKAVGLDMAHANNRYTAAKKARDSGLAQVTGPIVLVQGSAKTPGFLFYAPFYHSGRSATIEQRRQRFAGMVYAPFCGQKADARGLGPREPPRRHPDLRQR